MSYSSGSEGDYTGDSGSFSEGTYEEEFGNFPPPPGGLTNSAIKAKQVSFGAEEIREYEVPKKRGRGRPKGSTNKGKQKENANPNCPDEYRNQKSIYADTTEFKNQETPSEKWKQQTDRHMQELEVQRRMLEKERVQEKKFEFTKMLGGGPGVDYNTEEGDSDETAEKLIRMKHLNTIAMYHQFFPKLAASCPRRTKFSLKTPLRELEDEINRCKSVLKQDRAIDTVEKLDTFLDYGMEQMAIHGFGIRAQGLAAKGQASRAVVEEELKELAIKYSDKLDMSVEWRYLMKKLQLFGMVIEENERLYGSKSPQVDPSSVNMEQYAEL